MKSYPLLFTFHDKVDGNGFVADVETRGRALAVAESDGSWSLYGVKPGALAGSGETLLEAHGDFRLGFTAVLLDFAEEAGDFSTFEKMVVRFFEDTDDESVAEWDAAVKAVRSGKITGQELKLGESGRTIRQEPADSPRYVLVTCKQRFSTGAPQEASPFPTLAVAAA
jgi:hypothetical protein